MSARKWLKFLRECPPMKLRILAWLTGVPVVLIIAGLFTVAALAVVHDRMKDFLLFASLLANGVQVVLLRRK